MFYNDQRKQIYSFFKFVLFYFFFFISRNIFFFFKFLILFKRKIFSKKNFYFLFLDIMIIFKNWNTNFLEQIHITKTKFKHLNIMNLVFGNTNLLEDCESLFFTIRNFLQISSPPPKKQYIYIHIHYMIKKLVSNF